MGHSGNLISTSTDGGLTWGAAKTSADGAFGSGAEPLVQPNGQVVVTFLGNNMQAFTSTNGGASWKSSFTIANVNTFQGSSSLRSVGLPFPSTGIDKSGKLYVVWSDCSFRQGCATNDLVISTSTNGTKWTAPARIPIDALNSTVDHFIPGLGVDRATSGTTAHLDLNLLFLSASQLRRLDLPCARGIYHVHGWRQDLDRRKRSGRWRDADKLVTRLQNGPMLADYLSSSYVNGKAFGVFMVAKAPSGGLFDEAAYTTKQPLEASADEPALVREARSGYLASSGPAVPQSQGEERQVPALQLRTRRSEVELG